PESIRLALLEPYSVIMDKTALARLGTHLGAAATLNGKTGPLMVRIKDPAKALMVRDQLNAISNGAYKAWSKPDLAAANRKALMGQQIIGIFLGFSLFLGLLIGVGITSQTLRGAILASIKEFASLRALGVSMGSLSKIVLELAMWVGVAGLIATAVFTGGVYLLATSLGMPMGFPMPWVITVVILLLVISILSGIFSLGVLKRSQPADLLR
ncbi:MAG: ABC transporter permease, partial [Proteobacteria bacterium]|nr:ABC transporter permease [Pseudomonadota bacterium]